MGVSTDAYLFYGIASDDEEKTPEWMCQKLGLATEEEMEDEYFDWDQVARDGLPEGLSMDFHCHHEYPMGTIYADGTKVTAWRGHPVVVGQLPTIDPVRQEQLEQLAKKLGTAPPTWWLASCWG